MRYRNLGRTGLFVSEMCLGTMTFGKSSGQYATATSVTGQEAEAILRRALDAGVNFIDTANAYADGQSEEMLGRALKSIGIVRDKVVLATKVEHATGQGPNDAGASRYHIMSEVKASLKRLGTDHIDLYQLHGWDPATPAEEVIRTLDDLVRQGCVRYIGVSNWAAWQVAKALGVAERLHAARLASVQCYYSLAGRELEREILPMVQSEGLGIMVYSPLAGGYLSGKYRNREQQGRRKTIQFPPVDEVRGEKVLAAMDGIAKQRGASMEAIALAWLLQKSSITSIILGVTRLEQLEANLKALDLTLSKEDLMRLDQASALPPEYPGWMFAWADAARQALLETGTLPQPPR